MLAGEIVDAAVMRSDALTAFLAREVADARERGVLFSVHLKATMMKVSDPIIFGHAVRAYFADVFEQYADDLASVGADPNDGLGGVLSALEKLPEPTSARRSSMADHRRRTSAARRWPRSTPSRGITNLHVPSDVIIDASMPAAIRSSGQMWNAAGRAAGHQVRHPGQLLRRALRRDRRALPRARRVRPDDDGHDAQRRADGAEGRGVRQPRQDLRDPGGRHRPRRGRRRHRAARARRSAQGDICRACQTKDAPIRDWVQLAVRRARATGAPAVFWLDETRAHDAAGAAEGAGATSPSSTPTASPSRSWTSPRPPATRWSGPGAARTPSRSPATCCATTSPTCSRSSSSAPAPRCSRSCR